MEKPTEEVSEQEKLEAILKGMEVLREHIHTKEERFLYLELTLYAKLGPEGLINEINQIMPEDMRDDVYCQLARKHNIDIPELKQKTQKRSKKRSAGGPENGEKQRH